MNDESQFATAPNVLSGIRVIEVATFIFGPAAATVMADFGAEVIKVEPPGMGDPYRYLYRLPPMPECEENYNYILDGRNKRSIALDLSRPDGRQVLMDLVRTADVLIANQHPSVLAKLKVTYDDLRPHNPRLIYAHATGYGDEGEDVEQPGYDMSAYWARSGLMDAVCSAGSEPALSVAGMGDHPSAMTLFGGIMLALFRRERSGAGSLVSSSLMANGVWANACLLQSILCGAPPYVKTPRTEAHNVLINHYRTRDNKRLLLCSLRTEKDWPALCKCVERPDWLDEDRFATPDLRRQHAPELVALLDNIFAGRDYDDWKRRLTEHELVFSPVPGLEDAVQMPQLTAARTLVPLDVPQSSARQTVNSPIFLRGVEKRPAGPAPAVGQHSREILTQLGYTADRIGKLLADGTAAQSSQPA